RSSDLYQARAVTPASGQATEKQTAVGTAETKRIVERVIDPSLLRGVRNVIEHATLARVVQIDGRGRDLIAYRQHRENRFDRAGSAKQMSDHGFGRAHRDTLGGITHQCLDGAAFGDVASGGGGAVRVDVIDIGSCDTGV